MLVLLWSKGLEAHAPVLGSSSTLVASSVKNSLWQETQNRFRRTFPPSMDHWFRILCRAIVWHHLHVTPSGRSLLLGALGAWTAPLFSGVCIRLSGTCIAPSPWCAG